MATTPPRPADVPRLGRYELLARLGEGGMGVVHLARDPEGRRVALKLLRPHVIGDEEGRSRLAREVTTLRRVRSPRIAEIYDADPWGERPFVVTRYVPGRSLHEQVKDEGAVSGPDLRFLALGLAEAMVAVHEAGVLHRDIKPSNVLLEGRAPVLIDFGLAKLADDARLTVTGWLMGTPGYLAPEVLFGDEPTPASDVHAWAATVVYAASGTSPYGGGPAMAVMDRARRGEYDVSALPADLRPLIERGLSGDQAARPSAPELVARLGHLQSEPAAQPATLLDPGPMTAPLHPAQHVPPVVVPPAALAPPPRPAPPPPPPAQGTRPLTVPVGREPVTPSLRPASVGPPPHPVSPSPPSRAASSAPLRAATTVGLGLAVAAAVGLAPYVAAVVLALIAWLVRTTSLSGDAHRQRQSLRGPRRSDGFVRTLAWPWHLFVAMWGSVALLVCAALAGATVASFVVLIGQLEWQAALIGGAVFAFALWWGPGSGRLRHPVRRVVWRLATPDQAGIAWMLGSWLLAVVLMIVRIRVGVIWAPAAGSPFDILPSLP